MELFGFFALAWTFGGVACIVIWRISRKWPSFLRLSVRAFAIAMTIAPGGVVGEGGFAILRHAICGYCLQGHRSINPDVVFVYAVLPLLMVWAAVGLIFSLKEVFLS
jgi:hypothetical protein